jgi:hypothetical protein
MADTKISALPAATLPLAGTEVLPIVQSSTTKNVATDDLTVKNVRSNATNGILQIAGPAAAATRVMTTPDANFTAARIDAAQSFTGDQTLSTGNLVIGTSGKGIDFSATPGTGTSELFNDYEEGTWTGSLTAETTAPTTPITATGYYTKIGRTVTVNIVFVLVNTTGASGVLNVTGLPFTSNATNDSVGQIMTFGLSSPNAYSVSYMTGSATVIKQYTISDNAAWATVNLTAGTNKFLFLTHTYYV